MNYPKIYGQGAVFAFSGLDGQTDYKHDFVGSLSGDHIGVLFHLKVRRELFFELLPSVKNVDYKAVTHDVLDVDMKTGQDGSYPLKVTYANAKTIIGRTSPFAFPVVRAEREANSHRNGNLWTQSSPGEHTALLIEQRDEGIRFAFSFSEDCVESAEARAQEGLELNVDKLVKKRLSWFDCIPSCPRRDPIKEETYYKAFSILKGNILSAEGRIKRLWTTPDRIPHKNMWLWDSVFHSIALKYISPKLAFSAMEAVLNGQREDGFLPHMITPYTSSAITQPPLLAWGIWNLYTLTKDKTMLEKTYDKLKKYIEWDEKNRDRNRNSLPEWFIEGNVNCRSGESGMDNSPRFDHAKDMDAVDFSTFLANDMDCLRKMASELGNIQEAKAWEIKYNKIKENLNQLLWDKEDEIYYDRDMEGNFNKVKAVSCFIPMFAGLSEPWQAAKLAKHLQDPNEFRTPFPLPSVARNESTHSTDMWRGSVWINYNYMIIHGLYRYRYDNLAEELKKKTIDQIAYWYHQLGCFFEFYDSLGEKLPLFLDRKGICVPPYDLKRKIFPIRDYGWTAALYIALLLE